MPTWRAGAAAAVGVAWAAVAFAGCATPQDESLPPGFFSLRLATSYDRKANQDQPARHRATDLPDGTPARNMQIRMFITPGTSYRYGSWPSDPPCRSTDHGPVCDGVERKHTVTLPPLRKGDKEVDFVYPLDGKGEIVFLVSGGADIVINSVGEYSAELAKMTKDPKVCKHPKGSVDTVRVEKGSASAKGIQIITDGNVAHPAVEGLLQRRSSGLRDYTSGLPPTRFHPGGRCARHLRPRRDVPLEGQVGCGPEA